jgi:transposase
LGTNREIVEQFQVGKTFISKLLQRWKEMGILSPQAQGSGVKSKLEEIHLQKHKR